MMKKILMSLCMVAAVHAFAQSKKQVAITIDDVPFTQWSDATHLQVKKAANEKLLQVFTAGKVPVTLFINEITLQGTEEKARIDVLAKWLENPLVTAGNHGYQHANFNTTSVADFQQEVVKGEVITRQLLSRFKKPLKYFRFPYNATGKDSVSRFALEAFLKSKGYISTPFTIESQDYSFASRYQSELDKGATQAAEQTGRDYVAYTLKTFAYFEKVTQEQYGRPIAQIYLCHDNQLNADYMPLLLAELTKAGYDFKSLDEVMRDPVYQSTSCYTGPYGFSWLYRWEKDLKRRREMMMGQPEMDTPIEPKKN
ncbi:MAG: polysaccharide deacetylase [Cytophaga sp.]|nr:polysaccharide deacetylase [Cytophaga sp.]